MFGKITITNTGAGGPIYVRSKVNSGCLPGTTVLAEPGDDADSSTTVELNGDDLPCGDTFMLRVYLTDPGSSCPSAGVGGVTYTCTNCFAPH
jgi:hypothetical protein